MLEQIRLARHQHFGSRSERLSVDQLALAFNMLFLDGVYVEHPDGSLRFRFAASC